MSSEYPASERQRPPHYNMSVDAVSRIAGAAGAGAVTAAIRRASASTGSSFEILYSMAKRESSLDPSAKAKTSSAAGLFQFIEQTWLGAVKTYGAKHGLSDAAAAITNENGRFTVADPARRKEILDLRFDAQHASALAGELVQENRAALEGRLGREVGPAELYAAHFLGAAGAAKLLQAPSDAPAASLLPAAAVANKPVFYENGRARTVGEVMASIQRSMGEAGVIEAPETKSAFVSFASAEPVEAAEAITPSVWRDTPAADRRDVDGLSKLFAQREPGRPGGLSPLALAALQALDPRRLLRSDGDR